MIKQTLEFEIWGRKLPLDITFDCFDGEKPTQIQNDTLNWFLSNTEEVFNQSYQLFKEYCLKNYADYIDDDFSNIFRYIKPKALYIKRSITNKKIAGLLCNFKFDMEHGLVAYIEDGVVSKIGPQDIIL